jgi:hypothetical protein
LVPHNRTCTGLHNFKTEPFFKTDPQLNTARELAGVQVKELSIVMRFTFMQYQLLRILLPTHDYALNAP